MRAALFLIIAVLSGIWLNVVFNHYIQIGGLKPNWLLVFVLLLTFRHQTFLYPYLGILLGLICDALSHGVIGVFGFSFFVTLLIAQKMSNLFYANTFFAISFAVFSMSALESFLGLMVFNMLEPEISFKQQLLGNTLPIAFLQGIIASLVHPAMTWSEDKMVGETL